jgi:hypothetical protein
MGSMRRIAYSLSVVFLGIAVLAFSQDIQARKVFTTAPVEGGLQLDVGGKAYGPFAGIEGTPWFSRDGKHWAMVARRPDRAFVILVDGQEKAVYPKEYSRCWDVSISPDGGSWSVRAELASNVRARSLVIVDGKAQGPFDQVEEFAWSPAGRGWYARARTGGSLYVARAGKKYGPLQGVSDACFDAAGAKLALAEIKGGDTWIRVDDKEYGPYASAGIVRTGNGAYLGFLATLKNGTLELTVAGTKYGPYTYVDWGREYVSPDGRDWLVMVFRGSKRILLQNGKETELGRLSVYKLAKGWMYTYEKGNGQYLVFNGKQFGPFEIGRDLSVTRDGSSWGIRHLRTVAGTEQSLVTVNGKEYPGTGFAYDGMGADDYFSWVSGGVDSDAVYQRFAKELSTTTLYAVSKSGDGVTVSAGGKTWGPYREIACSPWASPDGSHWGLLARSGETSYVALVDGAESPAVGPYARAYDFTIADTGTGWGFTAVPDAKVPSSVRKVIDGREYGPFSWVDRPRFGPDGTGFYFWAHTEGKSPRGVLVFNGPTWGPFASDFAWRLLDLPAGVFALESRSSAGSTLLVNGDSFGPYREVQILRTGARSTDETGRYFGFVAVLADGSRELHVQGDKVYGPYRDLDSGSAWISDDGKDWMFSVSKQGSDSQVLLRVGVELETKGIDLRPWRDGFLLFVRQDGAATFTWKDGQAGPYAGVQGSWISRDGTTWVAEAMKGEGPGAAPVVIVNGREYPGQALRYVNAADEESFTWFSADGQGGGIVSTLKAR